MTDFGAIYGDPCRCGRGFPARHDSGLCEWCTAEPKRCRCYRCATFFSRRDDWPFPAPAKGSSATYIERPNLTADPDDA